METLFDYISVIAFLVIAGLFFIYSRKKEQDFMGYLWPSIGCALTNNFGNKGFTIPAFIIFFLVCLYIYFFIIKPGGIPYKSHK